MIRTYDMGFGLFVDLELCLFDLRNYLTVQWRWLDRKGAGVTNEGEELIKLFI